MYKFGNGQISLEDFGQPVGVNLKNSNRWVKRTQVIPCFEIEKNYAKLFSNKKGVVLQSRFVSVLARELFKRSTASPTPRFRFKSKRICISNISVATKLLTTASRRLLHQ